MLNHWVIEIFLGTVLVGYMVPALLSYARSVRQTYWDTKLPYDDEEDPYNWWCFRGIVLGMILPLFLHQPSYATVFLIITFLGALGAFLGEWLSHQILPIGNSWLVTVEGIATRLGVTPGELRFRQCAQDAPYAGFGGITLPSSALRKLDGNALCFAVAGALIARRQKREWTRLANWLLKGLAAYSVYIIGQVLEKNFGLLAPKYTNLSELVSVVLLLRWTTTFPLYTRADSNTLTDKFTVDREALEQTEDFEAAQRAIETMDTSGDRTQRIERLKNWWEARQQEIASLRTTTTVPRAQSQQPLGRKF